MAISCRTEGRGDSARFSRQPGLLLTVLLAVLLAAGPNAAKARDGRPLRLVALGDSLTAGYGLPANAAFPAVLEQALRARGYDVTVANAGRSGDTAGGGYSRLDSSVPGGTDGVILELGANDMLRGTDPAVPRQALAATIVRLRQRGIPVLLTGMRALPSLGPDYGRRFGAIYPDLARRYRVAFYPYFLTGVDRVSALNQPDGIHPNAAGVQRIVQGILPSVERLLSRADAAR